MRQFGFTLTELLIVIGLIALVSAFSINTLSNSLQRQTQYSRMDQLASVLLYARNYAISYNVTVKLCPSKNHQSCAGSWQNGAILLSDSHVLLSLAKLPQGHRLSLRAFPSSDYLQFNALGTLNSSNGKFIYRLPNGAIRSLLISKTGRVRFSDS